MEQNKSMPFTKENLLSAILNRLQEPQSPKVGTKRPKRVTKKKVWQFHKTAFYCSASIFSLVLNIDLTQNGNIPHN